MEPTSDLDATSEEAHDHPDIDTPPLEPTENPPTVQPISGFWRRLAAFLLDGLLLGLIGQVIALPFTSLWFQLGPYGRLVGWAIALAYFGLMDSRISAGQTLGKRLLKVAVRDQNGDPIGIGRSVLRTMIWLTPTMLNGWGLPLLSQPGWLWVASVIIAGVGGAVLLTLVFNRRTGQGLHDMITSTYVLRIGAEPVQSLPQPARPQWVLATIALVAGAILATIGLPGVPKAVDLDALRAVQTALLEDGEFFSVSVFHRQYVSGDKQRVLLIEGWYPGAPSQSETDKIINTMAATALTMKGVQQYDLIDISVRSMYDLGFTQGSRRLGRTETPERWKQLATEL